MTFGNQTKVLNQLMGSQIFLFWYLDLQCSYIIIILVYSKLGLLSLFLCISMVLHVYSKSLRKFSHVLNRRETWLSHALSKLKTCLSQTDFTVPSTECLYNLNLCKPSTCLNWPNSSVPKEFSLDRFYCIFFSDSFKKLTVKVPQHLKDM